jgi:hypothetical protein
VRERIKARAAAAERVQVIENAVIRRVAVSSIAWLDLRIVRRLGSAKAVVIGIKTMLQPAIVAQKRQTKSTKIHHADDNENSCCRTDELSTSNSENEKEEPPEDRVQRDASPTWHGVETGNSLFALWRVKRSRSIVVKASAKIGPAELCDLLPDSGLLLLRNPRSLPTDIWDLE